MFTSSFSRRVVLISPGEIVLFKAQTMSFCVLIISLIFIIVFLSNKPRDVAGPKRRSWAFEYLNNILYSALDVNIL